MKGTLRKLEFFHGIHEDIIHDVLYTMNLSNYNEGDILQKPGEKINALWIVIDGIVEATTELDDHKFKLTRLSRGSIINYRMWVMDDIAHVYLVCESNATICKLTIEQMEDLCKKHKTLNEKYLKFQKKLFQDPKNYPLDYILNILPEQRNKVYSKDR